MPPLAAGSLALLGLGVLGVPPALGDGGDGGWGRDELLEEGDGDGIEGGDDGDELGDDGDGVDVDEGLGREGVGSDGVGMELDELVCCDAQPASVTESAAASAAARRATRAVGSVRSVVRLGVYINASLLLPVSVSLSIILRPSSPPLVAGRFVHRLSTPYLLSLGPYGQETRGNAQELRLWRARRLGAGEMSMIGRYQ